MCLYTGRSFCGYLWVWSWESGPWVGGNIQVDMRLNCPFSVIMVPMLYIWKVQYCDNWRMVVPSHWERGGHHREHSVPLHHGVGYVETTAWKRFIWRLFLPPVKVVVEDFFFFWTRVWKRIHSFSSGGRLINRKLVRTTLSPDNLCKVLHRTGSLKLGNLKWHTDIRNQHCKDRLCS